MQVNKLIIVRDRFRTFRNTVVELEVVDSDSAVGVIDTFPHTTLFNLRGDNLSTQPFMMKAWNICKYYGRLLWYTAHTQSVIFHIQWETVSRFLTGQF